MAFVTSSIQVSPADLLDWRILHVLLFLRPTQRLWHGLRGCGCYWRFPADIATAIGIVDTDNASGIPSDAPCFLARGTDVLYLYCYFY